MLFGDNGLPHKRGICCLHTDDAVCTHLFYQVITLLDKSNFFKIVL